MPRKPKTDTFSGRISQKEMRASIFSSKSGEKVNSLGMDLEADSLVLTFTILGKEDGRLNLNGTSNADGYPALASLVDDRGNIILAEHRDIAYAKMVITNGSPRYFIKQNTQRKLFNPFGDSESEEKRRMMGEDIWQYRSVGRQVFHYYLNLLQTKNQTWITRAERAHYNG